MRREDRTLFERGGTSRGALSGEEYRQELRQAVEQGLRERIEQLPWGSGSGMAIPTPGVFEPGYVFCVRVADWKQPLFRYVGPDDGGTPIADTLACLDRARPRNGFGTPRVLDDETYRQAFDAWETARTDVVDKWNYLADKANLEPRIPPALTRGRRNRPLPRSPNAHPGPGRPSNRHPPRPLPPTNYPNLPSRDEVHPRPRQTGPEHTRGHRQPGIRALRTAQTPSRDHPRRRPPRLLDGASPTTIRV